MARKSKAVREEEFTAEMRYLMTLHKDYKQKVEEAELERDNIRGDMEKLMRKHNKTKFQSRDLLLSVSIREAKPSRRMSYNELEEQKPEIMRMLVKDGFLKLVPPKKKYRLEVRTLKPTKRELAMWEQSRQS